MLFGEISDYDARLWGFGFEVTRAKAEFGIFVKS